MSHAPGTYLGGIRTVECLRQRSHVDPDTACWHWRLSISQGSPAIHLLDPESGKPFRARGRAAAWMLSHGLRLPKGWVCWGICKHDDCVNPAHSRAGTRAAWGAWIAKTGMGKNRPAKVAANRRIVREKLAKLTPEQVLEIRRSSMTHVALSKIYGVSPSRIGYIKRGEAWADVVTNATVFTWRGAA
ncbi:hypothetical protein [Eleftheria terrae]|uniref:hypothetical protein n=1 Tax=Eleftheria terrae TaxID=1597781 RepID=UPI00263B555E|nr:hypothetical protein [Eleftheria terrae]WKB52999.1 hypothetical protein N7L95_00930 [Eleftheria terrae]